MHLQVEFKKGYNFVDTFEAHKILNLNTAYGRASLLNIIQGVVHIIDLATGVHLLIPHAALDELGIVGDVVIEKKENMTATDSMVNFARFVFKYGDDIAIWILKGVDSEILSNTVFKNSLETFKNVAGPVGAAIRGYKLGNSVIPFFADLTTAKSELTGGQFSHRGGSVTNHTTPEGQRIEELDRIAAENQATSDVFLQLPGGRVVLMEFVGIEGGNFLMGSRPGEGMSDENPWRSVEIRPITGRFQLGKYEVTMGQWTEVMGTTPWFDKPNVQSHKDYPAVYISWDHVQEFIARLNTGWGSAVFRLPTEAEWEYACRAGTMTKWSFGDDETQLERYAWYENNTLTETGTSRRAMPFGGKRSNHWFLYDMHGNVAEWVWDRYGSYQELMTENLEYSDYYEGDPWFNPRGPKTGSQRVYRGGSYLDKADDMRSAARFSAMPNSSGPSVGFRLLKADVPEWEEERFDLRMSMVKLEGFGSNEYEDFWLGKYEVTQYQWAAVMGTTPWEGKGVVEDLSHPAVYISWNDVQEFINRLNERTGDQWYRLPTEAEWEYACRAGTETPWSFGAGEDRLKHYAWYDGNTSQYQRVGWKGANPWGLHDMHGNVWEWVQDWDADDDSKRIGRGGSFKSNAQSVGSAHRSSADPDLRNDQVGFRLVRVEEPASWAINRATDRAALEALYHATNGDNWTNNNNWLSDRPLGEWHGVTADDKGRVVELNLSGNELGGEIPSALGNLSNLRVLWLHANELGGEIPSALGDLSSLQELYLYGNELGGEIPATLGNLSNLRVLRLYDNQLSGEIPSALGNLSNLQELYLYGNELRGEIPATLGDLSSLRVLELGGNELRGEIPSALGNLSNLVELSLYDNQLSGEIPSALGDLSSLIGLSLSYNELSGLIPSALGNLSNLRVLYLHGNELRGSIPQSYTSLSLRRFRFDNGSAGLCAPADEAFQNWLQGIDDRDNRPNCSEASEAPLATDRAALEALYHATNGDNWKNNDNWLSDRPLDEWHDVTTDDEGRVVELWLSYNELGGEIPSALGNLSNLQYLRLDGNELGGEIPSALGNLSNLVQLNLSYNRLRGEIPSALGNLSNLQELYLYGNELRGSIPQSYTSLSLEKFLFDNGSGGLCAPADEAFQNWLQGIALRDNGPNCPEASEASEASDLARDRAALEALYHATNGDNWKNNNNWLSDRPLGEWYGVTTDDEGRVVQLNLLGNELRGEIPATLDNLSSLRVLNLSGNELGGEIPATLGNLANLQELRLSYNELSGEIPSALGNLSSLRVLSLSGNQLSGEIPSALGNLANLQELYLSYNELRGEIPQSYTSLSLDGFRFFNGSGGLCAPADEAFQNWLQGIDDRDNRPNCSEASEAPLATDRAALEALYHATNGDNWKNNDNWLSDRPLGEWRGVTTDDEGRVVELNLSGHGLRGEIPSALGDLSNLRMLVLSANNELRGEIPSALGDLSNLQHLELSYNELGGEIPSALGNLSNLVQLDLFGNQLRGEIPSALGDLSSLRGLYLSYNGLGGEIPSALGNLSNLIGLYLAGNELGGEIPSALGNLSNLQWLNLDDNELGGEIPSALGNLSNLRWLSLDGNQLSGSIPQSYTSLSLGEFRFDNGSGGLCAPTDEAFQDWLQGIGNRNGPNCSE
ncbi:MAG: SUMF1/EgtB/PvdO family nonheme iron enzyme [Gemmatimonadetes bacterium]|nr:SUMF1/EgtB/PvdO family nonheme iron enzyme [Gemmatimonadota bacterium]